MTDEDVRRLYRCLLGRDPEDANTIAAFKAYYPTVDRGRRAIFTSEEFAGYFATVTGRAMQSRDPVAGNLALLLLSRAASVLPASPAEPPRDAALQAGMGRFFPDGAEPRLAVAIGQADHALDDLLPFNDPQSAVLHVAPEFPPVVPLTGTLDGVTPVFRLNGDPASIAEFLAQFGRRIDALCLLGPPAAPVWVDALRGQFAERCLVLVGPQTAAYDAATVSGEIARAHGSEPVQHWRGLRLHHVGGWLLPVAYAPPAAPPPAPDLDSYPSLAIACIVRNEAACIENMLRSAGPVASFFAVLDTGSDDGTPELARALLAAGDVPFAVAERDREEFASHFGAMRNAALALVPDWIEWVLMLDADEELVAEDYGPILDLIGGATHEAYALPRYNFPGADKSGTMLLYPDRQIRLTRHTLDGRIAYSNVVHETVRGVAVGRPELDQSAVGGPRGGPHIHHLVRRFRTPEQEDRKQAFYREIARREGSAAPPPNPSA